MEFEGQYLTYEEYKALGGTLDLMPFNLLEFEARNQIDLITHNRLVKQSDLPEKVKICMYNLINKINDYEKSSKQIITSSNIASETIDGYSVNYTTNTQTQDIVKSKNKDLEDVILTGLYGVVVNGEHIIYSGV